MVIYKLQFPIELKSRCWGRRERTKAETVRVARNRSCWRPEPRGIKTTSHSLILFVTAECFTFFISAIISLGSLDDVVFMLQVNRKDRGFTSVPSFTALLQESLD